MLRLRAGPMLVGIALIAAMNAAQPASPFKKILALTLAIVAAQGVAGTGSRVALGRDLHGVHFRARGKRIAETVPCDTSCPGSWQYHSNVVAGGTIILLGVITRRAAPVIVAAASASRPSSSCSGGQHGGSRRASSSWARLLRHSAT